MCVCVCVYLCVFYFLYPQIYFLSDRDKSKADIINWHVDNQYPTILLYK